MNPSVDYKLTGIWDYPARGTTTADDKSCPPVSGCLHRKPFPFVKAQELREDRSCLR